MRQAASAAKHTGVIKTKPGRTDEGSQKLLQTVASRQVLKCGEIQFPDEVSAQISSVDTTATITV
jgi:hypothetical protein